MRGAMIGVAVLALSIGLSGCSDDAPVVAMPVKSECIRQDKSDERVVAAPKPLKIRDANLVDLVAYLQEAMPPKPLAAAEEKKESKHGCAAARKTLGLAIGALEKQAAIVANNLANANTTAFKRGRVNFEDLSYRHDLPPGTQDSAGNRTAIGISVGLGTRVSGVQTDNEQGSTLETGNPLDLCIEGQGYFQVKDTTGELIYTRAGNLSINANGQLVVGSATTGRIIQPATTIPQDATEIVISPEGIVTVRQPGSPNMSQISTLQLGRFINPEGLLKMGENLYAETDASGPVTLGTPGQTGLGRVRQGALESSNVDREKELRELREIQSSLEALRQAERELR